MKTKYSLASSSWDEKEIKAIQEVIQSDHYTMGEKVNKFEDDFAKYFNSKFCVMVNSGSSANLLMVASLFLKKNKKLKPGDEVIVPAVSWSTTYSPLLQYGLKLKFVDIDLNTLNYNLEDLAQAITNNTKVIFIVNILGNPNDFSIINEICVDKDIIIIEDNCESMGAKYEKKFTGTFGLMGTFSFFYSHHISTMEGGAILTDDFELYNILKSIRAHGWTRDFSQDFEHTVTRDSAFSKDYNFVYPGYNVRPLEMSAAIGIEQIKKIPDIIRVRKENAKLFFSKFKDNDKFILQKEIGQSSWFAFSLIINPEIGIARDKLVKELKLNNIECRPIIAGNFVNNEVIKYFNYEIFNNLKNSDCIDEFGLYFGNSSKNLEYELSYLNYILNDII
tara:strand:- start:73 stop:1245 length:1173 start_codon:yes stop_codon:yes gene_type:complete